MLLKEGLNYKDMEGMMKPTIHVDEFSAKMGDDDDIAVISFFVRDETAARDLVNWFEKGYDFVQDADRSPGEIRPGRYLVYVEIRRRSALADQVGELIDDLSTLTEFEPNDWQMHYKKQMYPFSVDTFRNVVPDSPKKYREEQESGLNEMRTAAGIATKPIYDVDQDIRSLQNIAGI